MNEKEKIKAFFDGACELKNPGGIASYGFVVYAEGKEIKRGKGIACDPFSQRSSNNVAEYTAVVRTLEFLSQWKKHAAVVSGDSQLIIRQLEGRYDVRSRRILPLYVYANNFLKRLSGVLLKWIPREKNQVADKLSHLAYTNFLGEHPRLKEKAKPMLATEKQKSFMDRLGIDYYEYIGKWTASRLIEKALENR